MTPVPPPPSDALAQTSDRDLVNQLRAGNTQALATLYDRYAQLVYTLALRLLQNPTEAEDLTQDVFVQFWQSQKYDPDRGSVGSYLATYTRSRALDRLRVGQGRSAILKKAQHLTGISPPTPSTRPPKANSDSSCALPSTNCPQPNAKCLKLPTLKGLASLKLPNAWGCRWAPSKLAPVKGFSACAISSAPLFFKCALAALLF